jgi:hypothetical protein
MTNHDIGIWTSALGQMQLNRRRGKGDEYVGACPECGGKDRFHIWPSDGETGRFWCRQCDKRGDGIDYLRWQHNMTFQQACEATGKQPTRRRTINADTSWWKQKKPTTTYIPEPPKIEPQTNDSAPETAPVVPVQEPSESIMKQEHEFVDWYPENHAEELGCLECVYRHGAYCSAHPRNQFVNIRCIDKCPRPQTLTGD